MAHNQAIRELLEPWQATRYRPFEITLSDAVASIGAGDPLVEGRPVTGTSKWMFYDPDTNHPALFTHAAIWSWGTDLDTGNYVPEGETAPTGLPDYKIQNTVSNRCEVTFTFDTTADNSLFKHMQVLDGYIQSLHGFNRGNRPRRSWQDGTSENLTRFSVISKVFARATSTNTLKGRLSKVKYELHPWIQAAEQDPVNKAWIPNPDRPRLAERDHAKKMFIDLRLSNRPSLERFDIVWFCFCIGYNIGNDNWYPDIIPIDIARVGRLPQNYVPSTEATSYVTMDAIFPDLPFGTVVDVITEPMRIGKRRRVEEPQAVSSEHVSEDETEGNPETEESEPTRKRRITKGRSR